MGARDPNSFVICLEYCRRNVIDLRLPLDRCHLCKGWRRTFEVSDLMTLEQLASSILGLLGWKEDHLYEFRIGEKIYAFLGDDEYIVDTPYVIPCVSCSIPLRHVGLSQGDSFLFLFDFGDHHLFSLQVLEIKSYSLQEPLPVLLSYHGKNLMQYPWMLSKVAAKAFCDKPPSFKQANHVRDPWRIRFVKGEDLDTLKAWRKSKDKRLWEKAVTVLDNRIMSPEVTAKKIERPVHIIYRWITSYNHYGLEGLNRKRKKRAPGDREANSSRKRKQILEILHERPNSFGINRSNWSAESLAQAYKQRHSEDISPVTIRRRIRESGYSIKKARRVLSSPDPEYREKVELLLHTLQNLQPRQFLFFIDELGPLRVKKYGGRTFARRNEIISIPQNQQHRGSITMAGALCATTNQVRWLFSRSKDSSAMIDLIEILFNQYHTATQLYITWDAASWHKSSLLVEWLDSFNADTKLAGSGPEISLIPLPTSSQFLDVIEAVFSGMKRAIIHHSDYQSENEMKGAISRHFRERNEHFRENPKRAGEKIWEVDFFQDQENLRAGNYREW